MAWKNRLQPHQRPGVPVALAVSDDTGEQYELRQLPNGSHWCECASYNFSGQPKSCKHIRKFLKAPLAAVGPVPVKERSAYEEMADAIVMDLRPFLHVGRWQDATDVIARHLRAQILTGDLKKSLEARQSARATATATVAAPSLRVITFNDDDL